VNLWSWLRSDAGLIARIAIGATIFAALAIYDYARNREQATRWREYAILLVAVMAAMAYGVINDQITSSISWEYFYYGKDLAEQLGPKTPPDPVKLHWAAAMVGMKATWTAGLIIAVALLLSNNPEKNLGRLPIASLGKFLPMVLIVTLSGAALGATAGSLGLPARWDEDFAAMLRRDEMRPRRFMMVYGIHLGGYAGGAVGTIVAVWRIRRRRKALGGLDALRKRSG